MEKLEVRNGKIEYPGPKYFNNLSVEFEAVAAIRVFSPKLGFEKIKFDILFTCQICFFYSIDNSL